MTLHNLDAPPRSLEQVAADLRDRIARYRRLGMVRHPALTDAVDRLAHIEAEIARSTP